MQKKKTTPSDSGKKKWVAAILIMLLLGCATAAWAMWSREDPQVALVREMMVPMEQMEKMSREQRREHFEKMRGEMDKLTEEQRDQLRDEGRQRWEAREAKELTEFFQLPPEQQKAELDKRIDRMLEWQKERAKRDKNGDRGPGGRGRGERQMRGQSFGNDPSGQNKSIERNRSQLDRRSADMRGNRELYRRMMTERMRERGITNMGWGRGRGRG
jgi:hypothetical protein